MQQSGCRARGPSRRGSDRRLESTRWSRELTCPNSESNNSREERRERRGETLMSTSELRRWEGVRGERVASAILVFKQSSAPGEGFESSKYIETSAVHSRDGGRRAWKIVWQHLTFFVLTL